MRPGFAGIQALRALAAFAVAFLHISDEAGALTGTPGRSPWPWVDLLPLEAGVDLFFVISGFVMVWTCWDQFGTARSVVPFVWRRLLRIVPPYWLLSGATATVALLAPGTISDGLRDGWSYVAASFAFIPWRREDGFVQPVLRLGWTLEYEMLFYALVACALPLRRWAGVLAILGGIAALVLAGQWIVFTVVPLAFWTDPIVAEFALGVIVAVIARRGWRGGWLGLFGCVFAAALAWQVGDAPRALVRGVPAAMLLFSALSWRGLPGWLILLGDASYSLYLVHPFPMRALRVGFAHHLPAWTATGYVAAATTVSLLAAVTLHLGLERPVLRWGWVTMPAG